MNRSGPTLTLLVDTFARLRLACEAIGQDEDAAVLPADVDLDDLAPDEQTRLRRLGTQDLWVAINESNRPQKTVRHGVA